MVLRQKFSGGSRNESEGAAEAWVAARPGAIKVVRARSHQRMTRVGGLGPASLCGDWETLVDYEDLGSGKQPS